MGIFVRQDENGSQLSGKVAADLSERLNKRALEQTDKTSPIISDNQQKTKGGGLFWFIVIAAVFVAACVYLYMQTSGS